MKLQHMYLKKVDEDMYAFIVGDCDDDFIDDMQERAEDY